MDETEKMFMCFLISNKVNTMIENDTYEKYITQVDDEGLVFDIKNIDNEDVDMKLSFSPTLIDISIKIPINNKGRYNFTISFDEVGFNELVNTFSQICDTPKKLQSKTLYSHIMDGINNIDKEK